MERVSRPVTIELPMPAVAVLLLVLAMSLGAAPQARAASEATLFRIFLRDGTSVVSYGEFARLDGQVVFSMPAGGSADDPRLQVVTLPDATIDWFRTDQYVAAARDYPTKAWDELRTQALLPTHFAAQPGRAFLHVLRRGEMTVTHRPKKTNKSFCA